MFVCVFIFLKNEYLSKKTHQAWIDQADVRYLFNAWCPMKGHTHLNKPAQALKGYYKRVMTKIHNKSKKWNPHDKKSIWSLTMFYVFFEREF